MTNQEVFNKVAQHLLTQKQKSTDLNSRCLYYGPDNLKCAVGCLIPPEKYAPKFEVMSTMSVLGEIGLYEHYNLLARLQIIHDNYYPNGWKELLKDCAERFNLSTEVLCQP